MPADPVDPPQESDITTLLRAVRDGDVNAQDELVTAVYGELRRLAQARLRGERADQTLGATALVHEAWVRLGLGGADFDDRSHFFGAAARVMRQVLVDRYRRRHRQKRAHEVAPDDPADVLASTVALPQVDLLALDEALDQLAVVDARMARIVQLRFFAGLSVEETGAALGVSERTVKREWSVARAWLFQRIGTVDRD